MKQCLDVGAISGCEHALPWKNAIRSIIGSLLLIVASGVQAVPVALPEIYVTETPNAQGGSYTVTINQPDLTNNDPWYLNAWGITNEDAAWVDTGLTGWSGELFDTTSWDSGILFGTEGPFGELFVLFATGAAGIGDFADVFGPGSQAAVYWVSDYSANNFTGTGIVATSSNFDWYDGLGNSTAFAIISNATSGENLACSIGVGSSAPLSCSEIPAAVPIPAAAWLFGSGLLALGGMVRRRAG